MQVAVPSFLEFGIWDTENNPNNGTEAELRARLSCHLMLKLFKTGLVTNFIPPRKLFIISSGGLFTITQPECAHSLVVLLACTTDCVLVSLLGVVEGKVSAQKPFLRVRGRDKRVVVMNEREIYLLG